MFTSRSHKPTNEPADFFFKPATRGESFEPFRLCLDDASEMTIRSIFDVLTSTSSGDSAGTMVSRVARIDSSTPGTLAHPIGMTNTLADVAMEHLPRGGTLTITLDIKRVAPL